MLVQYAIRALRRCLELSLLLMESKRTVVLVTPYNYFIHQWELNHHMELPLRGTTLMALLW